MTKRDKVTVEDIIGIVHTDETTNSVEEVKKLRGRENKTEKRFTISIDSNDRKSLWDDERTEEEPLIALNRFGEIWGIDDCCKLLNSLNDEVQLARTVIQMKRQQIDSLKTENEQLKKDATILIYANQDYRKENEQLKADKQRLIDFIRKEFPKSYKHILEGLE